jgi:hypothetical protein
MLETEGKIVGTSTTQDTKVVDNGVSADTQATPNVSQEDNTSDTTINNSVSQKQAKTFTQDEVNSIIKERLSKVAKKYGFETEEELNEAVGKAQSYDTTKKELENTKSSLAEKESIITLMSCGIADKYLEIAKTFMQSKNMEINKNTINELLKTYPEWKGQVSDKQPSPVSYNSLGETNGTQKTELTEDERIKKIFGGL